MLLLDFIYLNEALPVNAQVPPLKPLYLTSSGEGKQLTVTVEHPTGHVNQLKEIN